MNNFLSEDESTDDSGVLNRWRANDFIAQNDTNFENFSAKRKLITEELQRILNLTPNSYDKLVHRIESKPSYTRTQDYIHSDAKSESLQITCEPVILKDPVEDNGDSQELTHHMKRPFLKRGSGLARFHMDKTDFQKPPKIYQTKEFRSYLKGERRVPSLTSRKIDVNTRQTLQVPVKPIRCNPSLPNVKEKPIMRTSIRPISSFDEEVIPSLRNVAVAPSLQAKQNSLLQSKHAHFKIPKTPMRELVLKYPSIDPKELERRNEKENKIFEKLEQRVEESDFCSQNSSVQKLLNDSLSESSSQLKPRRLDYDINNIKNPEESDSEEETELLKPMEKMKTYSENDIALRVKRKALQDNVKKIFECNVNHRVKGPVARRLVKKIRIKRPVKPRVEKVNLCDLKVRLEALEKEKDAFQRENNKLKRIQKELFDEKIKLEKQRKEDEKKIKEEYEKLMLEKEAILEGQKKLLRDKVVFEKYCKESKIVPTREEREELRRMKEELDRMKETLNTKEARWGSSQARFRNQVKSLEVENKRLTKELEEAKKLNVKKVTFDSQQSINTRVINAINTQLGRRLTGLRHRGSETAREPQAPKLKPLRRVKSAVDLQINKKSLETHASEKLPSVPVDVSDSEDDEDSVHAEEPEIINFCPPDVDEKEPFKRSISADSGVGSRPSISDDISEETIPRTCLKDIIRDDCCKADYPSACTLNSASSECAFSKVSQQLCNFVEISEGKPNENFHLQRGCCPSVHRPTSSCQVNSYSRENGPLTKVPLEEPINRRILPNGDKEDTYANGKKMLISNSGDFIRVVYPNGDIREKYLRSLREKYFYKESGVWQTTFTDRPGYQQLEMPDGRTVVYHPDGNVDTLYPNGAIARLNRTGTQEWRFKTGEIVRTDSNGDKILIFPDGRREFTSKDFTRLEEVDGTVKTVYKDGRQETKYPNGRVRIKDRHGNVIMNTAGFTS